MWIPIDVLGRDEKIDDTGFLVGFTNWTGHYHLLKGTDRDLIPEATVLEIGLRYRPWGDRDEPAEPAA